MNRVKQYSVTITFLAFIAVLTVLVFAMPKAEYSENEKRKLAAAPKITLESVTGGTFGKEFETFLSDHFPFRDVFYGINAYTERYTGRNGASGIYACDDGYLIATPAELNSALAARNVKIFSQFAEKTGLPATVIVVPDPGYILEEKLPANHLPYMDDELFAIVEQNKGKMTSVDLREDFLKSNEQIYYRTDHHLTAAGSYSMYLTYCRVMGFMPTEFSCVSTNEGFYGTGYSRSGLWMSEPDTLEIWENENRSQFLVTVIDGGESETYDSLYFPEHLENMDQYPVFLDGNHELVLINNQSVTNEKRLLLIKDSYAHNFATYAAEDFEMICMVDLRYYRGSVSALVEQYGLNEIMYLYGAENLAGSTDIAKLILQ